MSRTRRRRFEVIRQQLALQLGKIPTQEQVLTEYRKLRREKQRTAVPQRKRRIRTKRDRHVMMCAA